MRVPLVEVRHRWNKPALNGFLQVYLRSVWIFHGRQLIARLQEAGACRIACSLRLLEPLRKVQPILRRHIERPRVLETTMVEDHIHYHLQSSVVSLVAEPAIVVVSAEARIYAVVVGGGIAVIGGVSLLVVGRVVL